MLGRLGKLVSSVSWALLNTWDNMCDNDAIEACRGDRREGDSEDLDVRLVGERVEARGICGGMNGGWYIGVVLLQYRCM